MIIFPIFGILCSLVGLFFALLAIRGKNPQNLASTTGELTHSKAYRNYVVGKSQVVPIAIEYTYTYVVDGKSYRLSGVQYTHSRNVRKRIPIVYLRGFPCRAYEGHFSGTTERSLGACLLAAGVLCIIAFSLLK